MDEEKIIDLREKIQKGLDLSFKRLVEKTKKDDGELVFSDEEGNVVRIKATELEKQLPEEKL